LKGASLLCVWLPDPFRVTRDVDLLAPGAVDEAAIRAWTAEVCAVPCPEDGLRFDLTAMTVDGIRADDQDCARRARFRAFLGKARIGLQVDFGLGDVVAVPAVEITYPTLLPALPAPRLRAYPRELAIAEKFEAMVKLDVHNSRMKDFHDVWALSGAFEFDGAILRHAVAACLERRRAPATSESPRVLRADFYRIPEIASRWRSYRSAGAILIAPPESFEVIGERIRAFLGPVWDRIHAGEAMTETWSARGPWSRSVGGPSS
jgi:hypothetical protein